MKNIIFLLMLFFPYFVSATQSKELSLENADAGCENQLLIEDLYIKKISNYVHAVQINFSSLMHELTIQISPKDSSVFQTIYLNHAQNSPAILKFFNVQEVNFNLVDWGTPANQIHVLTIEAKDYAGNREILKTEFISI